MRGGVSSLHMRKTFFISIVVFSFTALAYAAGAPVKHDIFRKNVLRLFKTPGDQGIIYKRFKGKAYFSESVESCEVQLKSTATITTLDINFPTSNRSQVHVEFAYNREITEQVGINQLKYSSHYVSCSGDQYDTSRECWEYDHYEMMLEKGHDDLSNMLTVTLKGQSCSVNR
jgi:hypothetical protein